MGRTTTRRIGLRAWPAILFLVFFLSPYILLFIFSSRPEKIDISEFVWAFKNTFWESLGSGILALLLGFAISLGLFRIQKIFSEQCIKFFELAAMLPSFLPPIFILLIFFEILNPFPTGLAGIILVHGVMNAGLVGVLIKRVFEKKLIGLSEASYVIGASQSRFFRNIFGLIKKDILGIFYFVFYASFLSFSVPLSVGGGRGTTLEILIYEKVKISNSWGEALTLSLLQGVFLILLSSGYLRVQDNIPAKKASNPLLSSRSGLMILLIYIFGFSGVLLIGMWRGLDKVAMIPGLYQIALELLPYSLLISFAAGLMIFILLLFSAWDFPKAKTHQVLRGITAPSTALIGFGFLVVTGFQHLSEFLMWVFAFVLIYFTALYRLGWAEDLQSLRGQVQVANIFGASPQQIFKRILLPQLIPKAALIAGVASWWALGDFALSRIIFSQDRTLAMLIESLMSSYRIEAAMGLLTFYFALGFVLFLIFMGIHYVTRRELN